MNYQEHYFKTLYANFDNRVRVIAELIKDHPGEHGRVIEDAVSSLLRTFLPNKFSIGSGFVIDSIGARSRQSDIVIYDELSSFTPFNQDGRFLFPIECVYAVVEVKKTLNKDQVKQACQNIATTKKLVTTAKSSFELHHTPDGTLEYREYYATPPIGIIIGYQSETKSLETIKQWLVSAYADIENSEHHPDLVVSVREGFKALYTSISHRSDSLDFKFYPVNMRNVDGSIKTDPIGNRPQTFSLPKEHAGKELTEYIADYEGYYYNREFKLITHEKKPGFYQLGDDARLLLTTLGSIAKLLSMKRLTDSSIESYFARYYSEAVRV